LTAPEPGSRTAVAEPPERRPRWPRPEEFWRFAAAGSPELRWFSAG
jgi:hypothetical protein